MSGGKRRWRDYATPAGSRPVRDFIRSLSDKDYERVLAAMRDVATNGLEASRHLDGDIYEVRAPGDRATYRILFATEGRRGVILLALHGFPKTTRATPPEAIRLAKMRLATWRGKRSV